MPRENGSTHDPPRLGPPAPPSSDPGTRPTRTAGTRWTEESLLASLEKSHGKEWVARHRRLILEQARMLGEFD